MAAAVVAYVRAKRMGRDIFNERVSKLVYLQPSGESCQSDQSDQGVWKSAACGLEHPQLTWDNMLDDTMMYDVLEATEPSPCTRTRSTAMDLIAKEILTRGTDDASAMAS